MYLDLSVVGKVPEGCHDFGDGGRQSLLHRLLLSLSDACQAGQQVHEIRPDARERKVPVTSKSTLLSDIKIY